MTTTATITTTERLSFTWNSWLTAALLILLFSIYLGLAQFASPGLVGTDGYYHLKMAELMWVEGLKPAFPYLPLTVLNAAEFYNHHFLFHVSLIPFTLGGSLAGGQMAAAFFAALALLSVWVLLKGQAVPYAAVWAFGLLAISDAFLYRMSLLRAQSLSLVVLALGLHWMLTGKHRLLLPLGFVYVWLYNAFPLLPVLAGVYAAAVWLVDRRVELRPLLYAGAGVFLGVLINPYFPQDLIFMFRHFLPKLTDATAIRVGNEWFPYNTDTLLENSFLALVVFFSGILALGLSGKRMTVRTAVLLLTAGLFGLMLFQSRRFIEYFPPAALAFAALAWGDVPRPLSHQQSRGVIRWLRQHWPTLLLLALFLPGALRTFQRLRDSLGSSLPGDRYAAASAWLEHTTPAGSLVFQTDWDDFTRLFYYNTHNHYLVGLDPTYLQLADPALYALWVEITEGKVELPAGAIHDRFGASYVFSDLNHTNFIEQAASDPGLREVYRDQQAVIYQVMP